MEFDKDEMQVMLDQAAEQGAKKALASIGLADENAGQDIRDLRGLLGGLRFIKKTAVERIVEMVVNFMIIALLIGIIAKLKNGGFGWP